jgi:hypothetical protein
MAAVLSFPSFLSYSLLLWRATPKPITDLKALPEHLFTDVQVQAFYQPQPPTHIDTIILPANH